MNLRDSIDAAPSIGPKTAEQFGKLGIQTVGDFLGRGADEIARRLENRRITSQVVGQWQSQCRLVCRIPNLRGHDAQILVACGFNEPESVASMDAGQLFDIVEPFANSKEGQRIIRNGKQPDLDEICDWIRWAGQTRALQAA